MVQKMLIVQEKETQHLHRPDQSDIAKGQTTKQNSNRSSNLLKILKRLKDVPRIVISSFCPRRDEEGYRGFSAHDVIVG